MQKLRIWLGDIAFYYRTSLRQKKDEPFTARLVSRIVADNLRLSLELSRTQAEKRTMRDSVLDHMAYEGTLREEISSLKRHLNMAIDERDQAHKRKRSA